MRDKKSYFRVCFYLMCVGIIYLIPLSFIEPRGFCIWYRLFHINCLGCGFTHAFFYFIHGHFQEALDCNPMVLSVLIVLSLILEDFYRIITNSPKPSYLESLCAYCKQKLYTQNK